MAASSPPHAAPEAAVLRSPRRKWERPASATPSSVRAALRDFREENGAEEDAGPGLSLRAMFEAAAIGGDGDGGGGDGGGGGGGDGGDGDKSSVGESGREGVSAQRAPLAQRAARALSDPAERLTQGASPSHRKLSSRGDAAALPRIVEQGADETRARVLNAATPPPPARRRNTQPDVSGDELDRIANAVPARLAAPIATTPNPRRRGSTSTPSSARQRPAIASSAPQSPRGNAASPSQEEAKGAP